MGPRRQPQPTKDERAADERTRAAPQLDDRPHHATHAARLPQLDHSGRTGQQLPAARPQDRNDVSISLKEEAEASWAKALGDVASISHDDVERVTSHENVLHVDPVHDGSRHADEDDHSELHAHTDASRAARARREQDERRMIADTRLRAQDRCDPDRGCLSRAERHVPRSHDDTNANVMPQDDARPAAQVEREARRLRIGGGIAITVRSP
jgi:hypothetical protein